MPEKEKVVYLLGAGFSAPLGLPVIRDFLQTAKDLCFKEPERYGHLRKVLDTIRDMSPAKTYYDTDLRNVEEVLSILEMRDMVAGTRQSKSFASFIEDVIQARTPQTESPHTPGPSKNLPAFMDRLFQQDVSHELFAYGHFVAALLGVRLTVNTTEKNQKSGSWNPRYSVSDDGQYDYSVVTLNYDLVLENLRDHIQREFPPSQDAENTDLGEALEIAKLHGSVGGEIVAPTSLKWAVRKVADAWKTAYRLFSEANHIRILGYSLPESDGYIRYLLSAAATTSENLKRIDVVNTDPRMKEHFRKYVCFRDARFCKIDSSVYLRSTVTMDLAERSPQWYVARFSLNEGKHEGLEWQPMLD